MQLMNLNRRGFVKRISGGQATMGVIPAMSAFHFPVAPHGSPHKAIHLLASLDNALIMETYPGVESQYNPVLPLYPVKDGNVTVPETPGLGIDPDPELVKQYQTEN
jgi:L-alanine-DL-glutamate epimerase-like enolase superfamily enzyme